MLVFAAVVGGGNVNEPEIFESIVCPASEAEPRQSEGSVTQLAGGDLLLAWTEFYAGAWQDHAPARISGKRSPDLGRSWGETFVLQDNDARENVMSASLLRLGRGRICLFYLRKNSGTDLQAYVRHSADDGKTWGDEVRITDGRGYHVMNNDRVVKLRSGRLIAPIAWIDDIAKRVGHQALCYYSDDDGQAWRKGATRLDLPKRGAMEPGVVELRDGRLLMIIRSQLGRIYRSLSGDEGVTWSPPEPMDMIAPEAPSSVSRLPGGELLLVWNNNVDLDADHSGRRNPLTCAISRDEGETWENFKNLEHDPQRTFAYTSIAFVGPADGPGLPEPDRAIFTYWSRDDRTRSRWLKLKSVPLEWFYE